MSETIHRLKTCAPCPHRSGRVCTAVQDRDIVELSRASDWPCPAQQPGPRIALRETSDAVAVVVPCGPGYHAWLAECLQSIREQRCAAAEIVVVADRCPEAAPVVRRFPGVRLLPADVGNVWSARRIGYEATAAPLLTFVDADDRLDPGYLAAAVTLLQAHPEAVLCHTDWRRFGPGPLPPDSAFPERVEYADLSRRNYIHAAAVVRRAAIELTDAFRRPPNPRAHEDWFLWRTILHAGGCSLKAPGRPYHYRNRRNSRSRHRPAATPWAETYAMELETVPLLIPLSGRRWAWPQFRAWLDAQTWPHDQVELRILDTSQDEAFGLHVRHWLAGCDYPHISYQAASVADRGLADRPRVGDRVTQQAVNATMLRIWKLLTAGLTRSFAVTVEDDVLPPVDAIAAMLKTFTHATDAVAIPYRHRFEPGRTIPPRPPGARGTGPAPWCAFGCTAWRLDQLNRLWSPHGHQWYDVGATRQMRVLARWDLQADHRDPPVTAPPAAVSVARSS